MIYYLCSATKDHISGGVQKLFDHVAILNVQGFDAEMLNNDDIIAGHQFTDDDIVVIPEVFGDGIRDFVPPSVTRRVIFVQNPYLIDEVNGYTVVHDQGRHPYLTTPELEVIFTESEHSTRIVTERFPELMVPVIRTHSSGNGRHGADAGFSYGEWPRKHQVCFFGYKHETLNAELLEGLDLPPGWSTISMTGMSNDQIAETFRTSAMFVATNFHEGMCAPTSEAMISGCVIVCWTGGGPDEYLEDRAVIAPQDDMVELRHLVVQTATSIDENPGLWAAKTREWSDWFQDTYSRQGEIDELIGIWEGLGFTRQGPKVNLGCGAHYAPGWLNLDTVTRDDTHPDLVVAPEDPFRGLEPASRIFIGHVLEHVFWVDVPAFLARVWDALAPYGEVLIVGPDVYRVLDRWHRGLEPWWLVEITVEGDHHDLDPADPGIHKWNCHEARIVGALQRAGFVDVTPIPVPDRVHVTGGVPGWPVNGWSAWQFGVKARRP